MITTYLYLYEVDSAMDLVGPLCKPQRLMSYYNGNQEIIYILFFSFKIFFNV